MTNFSKDLVIKVAKLARIKVTNEEIEKYVLNLSDIFEEIQQLQSVNTQDIEPLSNVTKGPMNLRDDEVTDGNYVDDIIKNAKNAQYNCFAVPKVIE